METLGPINESARAFLDDLDRRISVLSGDDREHLFLFQRISVAIQQFYAVLLICYTTVFPMRTTRTSFSTSNFFVFFLIFSHPPSFLRGLKIIKMHVPSRPTHSLVLYGFRSSAWRSEVAGGCTGQLGVTVSKSDARTSEYDHSIIVSPRVTWLRVTIRHTCQHVTCFQQSARTHCHWTWTVWKQHNVTRYSL